MSDAGSGRPYAGDVDSATAWQRLEEDADAVLIDVRTTVEWANIGVPDLQRLGKRASFVEWQQAPDMRTNPRFLEEVSAAGIGPEQTLYLLCRSGQRSAHAAAALTAAGYARCINVADGFEGPPDAAGRRGRIAGWQAAGLPWRRD